jgi:hypothetical protein
MRVPHYWPQIARLSPMRPTEDMPLSARPPEPKPVENTSSWETTGVHGSEHACSGPEAERQANEVASAFLMPRASVLGHMPSGAHVDQILRGKQIWNASAMALTYRMHDLGLLSDWQYRSTCAELSRLGYRSGEPQGMGQRETSQVLTKVFAALRSKSVPPRPSRPNLVLPARR